MVKLSDFNTLFGVAFGISAIFVWIDFIPLLHKRFEKILNLDGSNLEKFLGQDDFRYVFFNGWTWTVIGYATWIARLKMFSALASVLSLGFIILAAYKPNLEIGIVLSIFISFLLLGPTIFIPCLILIVFPRFRVKTILRNLCYLENNEKDELKKRRLSEIISNIRDVIRGVYVEENEKR